MNESRTSMLAMVPVLPRGNCLHLVGHGFPTDCDRLGPVFLAAWGFPALLAEEARGIEVSCQTESSVRGGSLPGGAADDHSLVGSIATGRPRTAAGRPLPVGRPAGAGRHGDRVAGP